MLSVSIPSSANVGDSYSLSLTNPSATSDGLNADVQLSPLPPVTILVTNIAYTVGNSASPGGGWYNAGEFGATNLDNADVNNAFSAAAGLRVPYAFSDIFNAMDAYPPDAPGFVGGDGRIRFLDWQVILQRSLRLETDNWARAWSTGGVLTNFSVALLPGPMLRMPQPKLVAPWYRQALVGAVSLGQALPGTSVAVPVYSGDDRWRHALGTAIPRSRHRAQRRAPANPGPAVHPLGARHSGSFAPTKHPAG